MGVTLIIIGVVCIIGGVLLLTRNNDAKSDFAEYQLPEPVVEQDTVEKIVVVERIIERQVEAAPVRKEEDAVVEIPTDVTTEVALVDTAESTPEKSNADDEAHVKGLAFEEWIVSKFDKKYWTLKEWRGDKYSNGVYAESNQYPDLELTLKARGQEYRIAIECKYRSRFKDDKIKWSYDEQVNRYKSFASRTGLPTFIIIGVGGSASDPQELYIVPIEDMPGDEVSREFLQQYKRKNAGKNFYYNGPKNRLSLSTSSSDDKMLMA